MKVAIDISQIVYGTGVSIYTEELIKELSKLPDLELALYAGSIRRQSDLKKFKAKVFPLPPTFADIIWNRLHILPVELLIGKVDLVHTSDWSEPPSRIPKVTTIHDLAPILYPNETDPYIVNVHNRKLEHVKRESKAIIVPSYSTRRDLVNLGFNDEKISVIYEALSTKFEVSDKPMIDRKYLLAVGTAKRKNLERIIASFFEVKKEHAVDELIVVGQKPDMLIDGVTYMGRVSDKRLSELYAGAEALVYASLYEGFGFPILEAFASKCPVVTSQVSSMSEVGGEAAILVNPKSVSSIVTGILNAIRGRKLLVKKGVKRVSEFSWKENALKTFEVYKQSI